MTEGKACAPALAEYPDFRAADIDQALGRAREVHGDAGGWLTSWVLFDHQFELDADNGVSLRCELADAHADALAVLRAGELLGARSAARESPLLFETIRISCSVC